MAYLLRFLLLFAVIAVSTTILNAKGHVELPFNHILLAIPTFIYVIFIQAFVMFYFIGTNRFTKNIIELLQKPETNNHNLDLADYKKKAMQFFNQSTLYKRQTTPWTMLILVLGILGFLLGGAHDTDLISKNVHSGVIYGFFAALLIGFVRQWFFLGKAHVLLRKIKSQFSLPDNRM